MIREKLSQFFYRKYNQSFSQCGEDMILAHLLPFKAGFFVDIGAYHPVKFSNTYLFYKKGWRGINIDAAPGTMSEFKRVRPEDSNLEVGVSDKDGVLTFYFIDEGSSMNTFDYENLKMLGLTDKIKKQLQVPVRRLDNILDEHLKGKSTDIDFISIDVEGHEFNIIASNNWEIYRPKVILLESFETMNSQQNKDNDLASYLKGKGYSLFSKTPNSIFFLRDGLSLSPTNNIIV